MNQNRHEGGNYQINNNVKPPQACYESKSVLNRIEIHLSFNHSLPLHNLRMLIITATGLSPHLLQLKDGNDKMYMLPKNWLNCIEHLQKLVSKFGKTKSCHIFAVICAKDPLYFCWAKAHIITTFLLFSAQLFIFLFHSLSSHPLLQGTRFIGRNCSTRYAHYNTEHRNKLWTPWFMKTTLLFWLTAEKHEWSVQMAPPSIISRTGQTHKQLIT